MKKFRLFLVGFIILCSLFASVTIFAQVLVGVKEGDWIEYKVSYTGSPSDTYPKWVKIQVLEIQGMMITAELIVERLDGTSETNSGMFNLETGVPDLLLIPANLEVGSEFYHTDFGNVTIAGTEEDTYAGAKRTMIYAPVGQTSLHWDQTTGILLQSNQYADTFTQIFLADKTNLWQAQIFGLEPTILLMLIIVIVAIVAVLVFVLFRRRR